jgi:hypothetical protein
LPAAQQNEFHRTVLSNGSPTAAVPFTTQTKKNDTEAIALRDPNEERLMTSSRAATSLSLRELTSLLVEALIAVTALKAITQIRLWQKSLGDLASPQRRLSVADDQSPATPTEIYEETNL